MRLVGRYAKHGSNLCPQSSISPWLPLSLPTPPPILLCDMPLPSWDLGCYHTANLQTTPFLPKQKQLPAILHPTGQRHQQIHSIKQTFRQLAKQPPSKQLGNPFIPQADSHAPWMSHRSLFSVRHATASGQVLSGPCTTYCNGKRKLLVGHADQAGLRVKSQRRSRPWCSAVGHRWRCRPWRCRPRRSAAGSSRQNRHLALQE